MNLLQTIFLGRSSYAPTWELQKKIWALRVEHRLPDVLLLVEHDHVYTFGKRASEAHLLVHKQQLAQENIDIFNIDRGGDVTYHGPGQLVGYPIIDLQNYRQDVHWYLRTLEEVLINTINCYGIRGQRVEGLTGVWVKDKKIAAIGVKISRWVTIHGFALNVNTDLSKFFNIIPCGIRNKGVTSLEHLLNKKLSLQEVACTVVKEFCRVFECTSQEIDKEEFLQSIELQSAL